MTPFANNVRGSLFIQAALFVLFALVFPTSTAFKAVAMVLAVGAVGVAAALKSTSQMRLVVLGFEGLSAAFGVLSLVTGHYAPGSIIAVWVLIHVANAPAAAFTGTPMGSVGQPVAYGAPVPPGFPAPGYEPVPYPPMGQPWTPPPAPVQLPVPAPMVADHLWAPPAAVAPPPVPAQPMPAPAPQVPVQQVPGPVQHVPAPPAPVASEAPAVPAVEAPATAVPCMTILPS